MTTPVRTGAPPEPAAAGSPRTTPSRPLSARFTHRLAGVLFVTPFTLLFLTFLVAPLCYAFWLSLHKSTMVGGEQFSGLDSYVRALKDPQLRSGLVRVLAFGAMQIPVMIGIALLGALLIDHLTTRFAKTFRLVVFMPYAVPAVIGALMWGFLYSPTFGPLHSVVHGNLFSGDLMLVSLSNIVTWQWTGYNMIVIYSALQGLPRETYEVARVDGASVVQTALRIKIPMISPALVLTLMFTIIGTLQFFTEPVVLRPLASSVITPDYTPNLYAFSLAFQYSEFDYSAAISFVLGAVVFLGSYLFLFATRRRSALQ